MLLSGGMDSIAVTWWQRPAVALTVDYGQVCSRAEIRAAEAVASELGIRHEVICVDCRSLGSGDLAGAPAMESAPVSEWWPYRNQLLVTLSAMRAISLNVGELLLGTVRSDECHADGRPEFVDKIDALLRLQEGHLRVRAPAATMTAVELVQKADVPRELLAWAHSCHRAEYACGECRGCNKHRETMEALGYGSY